MYVIPLGKPTNEAKTKIETDPATAETKISKWSVKFKTIQTFFASYPSNLFVLFLQWNSFLFHLYFF